jgi:hypothetical protein
MSRFQPPRERRVSVEVRGLKNCQQPTATQKLDGWSRAQPALLYEGLDMKLFLTLTLSLYLASCAYPQKRVGIIHDYIFTMADNTCRLHSGLHYVVSDNTLYSKTSGRDRHDDDDDDYPCHEIFYFRCQDGSVTKYDDEIGHCFIPESQLQETLEGK